MPLSTSDRTAASRAARPGPGCGSAGWSATVVLRSRRRVVKTGGDRIFVFEMHADGGQPAAERRPQAFIKDAQEHNPPGRLEVGELDPLADGRRAGPGVQLGGLRA